MEYYKNYMDDAVVRVDDDGKRYVKWLDYRGGQVEYESSENPDTNTRAYGGEGFGVFYELVPISKEDYDSFGYSWTFGYGGEKVPISSFY